MLFVNYLYFALIVLNEKDAEINKTCANYELEMQKTIEDSKKIIEESKIQITEEEMSQMRKKYEIELKNKEESHAILLRQYNEKCQSWQLEKQVCIN